MIETLLRPEFLVAMAVILGGTFLALAIFRPQLTNRKKSGAEPAAGADGHWSAPAGGAQPAPPEAPPGVVHQAAWQPGGWQQSGRSGPAAGAGSGTPPAGTSEGRSDAAGAGEGDDTGGSAAAGSQPGSPSQEEEQATATLPAVTFDAVAGLEAPIDELQEVADYLRSPERFRALGAQLPKGILLHGPPGCGKTLLAKALAGEAGVAFHSVSATEFVEQYVGTGAKRVRNLFKEAEKNAPAIVFVDELDAIGRQRADDNNSGGHEFDHTLNQLLVELDGFLSHTGVVVVGATNRPELIDSALVRPGRFDRRVQLERPDRDGRQAILELHARSRPVSGKVDWSAVAANTAGISAAELANLVNEAALLAARRRHTVITPEDVDEAESRVLTGTPNDRRPQGRDEWSRVAVHEAGHAALSLVLRGIKPPARVSVLDRAGGATSSPWEQSDDRQTLTSRQLRARLILLFGGRAAELEAFGEPSTRAEDDLEKAAALARRMVERWAMTGRYELAGTSSEDRRAPYIEGTAGAQEVRELLAWAEHAARTILADREGLWLTIAEALAQHETLSARQLERLFQRVEQSEVTEGSSRPRSLSPGSRASGQGPRQPDRSSADGEPPARTAPLDSPTLGDAAVAERENRVPARAELPSG